MPQMQQKRPGPHYRQQIMGGVLGLVVIGFGVWFFLGNSLKKPDDLNTAGLWDLAQGGSNDESSASSLDTAYENHAYGFRFEYPSTMTVGELEESGGYVVLAESSKGQKSFQVFVLPWDEGEAVLTPERVRQDLPDIVIANPQIATLPDGRQALIFESKEGDMATREVWLVHDGYLYQITASLALDATLAEIMATWTFE
jgi:hypothetical protein